MAADEEKESALNSLADDMVKLVAYTIVSLKRGHERVMTGGEGTVIVTDNMTGKAFISWILAKYLQEEVEVKEPGNPPARKPRAETLTAGELKYLRVYYVVSTRWPRFSLAFESEQVKVLKGIRDELAKQG